jgi:diacylglycerol kinase family enzyme
MNHPQAPTGGRHVLLVYNNTAGAVGEADLWLGTIVNKLCNQLLATVTVFPTQADSTPEDLLANLPPSCDLVVAAGGDGTVRLVLEALASTKLDITAGIVPVGTANILARNLGLYEDSLLVDPIDNAIETILHGKVTRIDLGIMNGTYFAVSAGVGPLSDATVNIAPTDKSNWRLLAYASSLLQTFAMPPVVFKIKADHHTFQIAASGIFVSNVADIGMGILSETALLTDGYLDLCILNPQNFQDYVQLGFHFAGGLFGGEAPYYISKVKVVDIEVVPVRSPMSSFQRFSHRLRSMLSNKPGALPPRHKEAIAMIDGDACGGAPMHVEVLPGAVAVLTPNPQQRPTLRI